jgi:large subunit ribosomal protein L17
MRHKIAGRKFDRPTAHRLAMYRNLVTDLLRYEQIKTTEAKAKEIRGMAEKMITLGKDGTLPARRRALAFIYDKDVVHKVFDDLGKRYQSRTGGYTRIVRIGPRLGDGAPIVSLELVQE